MTGIEIAREKYRPESIKLMFIAEAPPCTEGRFFYFENVSKGDSLFLHVIRAVFPDLDFWETKEIRAKKEELLYRFRDAGYFLEDSTHIPIPKGTRSRGKESILIESQAGLLTNIKPYKANSKIVLLSATVFRTNYEFLINNGFTVINDFIIPFPGSGQQTKFKEGIKEIDLS